MGYKPLTTLGMHIHYKTYKTPSKWWSWIPHLQRAHNMVHYFMINLWSTKKTSNNYKQLIFCDVKRHSVENGQSGAVFGSFVMTSNTIHLQEAF